MKMLYVLGGPPRTAKTTIMCGLASKRRMSFIAADAVEHGLRNVLTGQPHQMLRNIKLSGSAEQKDSIIEGGNRKSFVNEGTESEFTLQAIVGMIDYYRRNNESIAFEGAAFTPIWVHGLELPDYTIRAAFVGYTDPAHADTIISYAKHNPHDWINDWLKNENGDATSIRAWVRKQSEACFELKAQAEQLGYPYFDISSMPFEHYVASVHQFLLEA